MKYVVIIPDGAADRPIPELNGLTPLEAAETPNLDRLARRGRVGTAATTPPGFGAGSDVCTMDLLGYDPAKYHTGRAPLEAAALGIETTPAQWIFRLNLVTVGEPGTDQDGLMLDHSAGGISDDEARTLVAGLADRWRQADPELAADFELTPGVGYRSILVDRSDRSYAGIRTTPPHEIPGRPWADHLPEGDAPAGTVARLMEIAQAYLTDHEINQARREQGLRPANAAWIWGQGTRPRLPSFVERFGLKGGMITSVDLLAGIARLIGWDLIDCPGLTSYHDTDYEAQGRATIAALDRFDIVCCHIEAPDEASHQADWQTKVASLETIDRAIIGPVMEALDRYGDPETDPGAEGWRVLVMPDHYTLCSTRKHDPTPVPFAMAGAWVRSVVERTLTEAQADASDLHIDPGHDLMEYFLRSGLARGPGFRRG
ncbi:MAG: cofactor-independent phosphoglycerate mutase [Phycisphaerales bacterium]|nr:cofactor-independent phosphoglycerate mutase [Planctomycetota bacterium]MCH8507852.1 cofactor-independent phosphoglycerate mutase [Phycisphaerales bacterium]